MQIIAYLVMTPSSLVLSRICLVAMFVSFACGIAAVCLLWHSTYPDYNFAQGEPSDTPLLPIWRHKNSKLRHSSNLGFAQLRPTAMVLCARRMVCLLEFGCLFSPQFFHSR